MKQRIRQKQVDNPPMVTEFEFDESYMTNGELKVKSWNDYCEEWAKFVIRNRNRKLPYPWHDFDIVYGPIADDGVTLQIRRYESGFLTLHQLIEELKYNRGITFQYLFANEKAIKNLKEYATQTRTNNDITRGAMCRTRRDSYGRMALFNARSIGCAL